MRNYIYDQPNEQSSNIRILVLLPGRFDDPLKGLLYTTTLDAKHTPTYEALSYAWGTQVDPESVDIQTASGAEVADLELTLDCDEAQKSVVSSTAVSVRETQTFGTVPVTRNLATLLPYLRLPDRSRTLWINALCVNQSDARERSQQVRRMADIYQKATRVFLGWRS